ncbi:hypothetical protein CRUP_028322 [Coryphaenoides rupestris]|nr:hypothetical protein CRUP_028322 [Coryphaenoides rupestris]
MEDFPRQQEAWLLNASFITSNSSRKNPADAGNKTWNPLKRNEDVAKVEVAVLVLVLLLALVGNLCVLVAIRTAKHRASRMYYFMKHLSIADLVVAVFQVLPQLIWDVTFRFYGPDVLCRLVKYLQVVGMFASTYMLVLMSVDRCLAVCQPLRSLHTRRDRVHVVTSWTLSLVLSCPQVYIFSLREVGDGVYDCWGDFVQPWGAKAYVTWMSLTIYIIPVAILSRRFYARRMEDFPRQQEAWLLNASFITSNSSRKNPADAGNKTWNPLKRNEDVAKVEVAVLVLVLLLALVGNLCVLVAIRTAKHRASRMYYFMKHLSIADLVVAVFQVLPQLIWDVTFRFYGPDVLCRLVKYLQVPLRSLHTRRDRVHVVTSWTLSLVLSCPQVYIFSLREVGDGVYDCWGDFVQPWGAKAYVTWMSLTIYIIPVAILSVCYGLISFKIWQNFKLKTLRGGWGPCTPLNPRARRDAALSRVSSVRLISKAKIRTVKMTFVIVVAYIGCWTPFFFVQMWSAWDPGAPREDTAFIIAMLLASLNSCCNPWIYMLFAGHLFRDLLRCVRCCCCRSGWYPRAPSSGCGQQCRGRASSSTTTTTFVMKSGCSQRSLMHTSSTVVCPSTDQLISSQQSDPCLCIQLPRE